MHPWNLGRMPIAVRGFARSLPTRGLGLAVAVICAGFWQAGAGAEDAGKPRGPGIDEGVREWSNHGKPVPGALQLLARVNAELRTGGRTDLLPLRSMLFEEACRRASGEELRALGAMIPDLAPGADGTPHDCDRFKKCITFYASAAFRQEMNKLIASPAQLKLPPSTAAPPAELATAPKSLRDAWLARAMVMEPFERLKGTVTTEPAATAEPAGTSDPAATKETREARPDVAVLKKLGPTPAAGLWRELILQAHREEQNPIKGDGAISRRALHFGIALSLLAEGKLDMAAGAICSRLFAAEGGSLGDSDRPAYAALARDFLSAQGLNWELIFMGLLLREHSVKPGGLGKALASTEPWLMLGAFGSPRGVQAGLDWIKHSKLATEEARPFLLRVLGPDPVPQTVQTDYLPKRVKALPPEIRAQAITALAGYLDPTQPLTPLNRTLEDVSAWLAKDLGEPLKKLLAHRNRLIAMRALWLLKSAGLVPEETKLPPGPAPIRLRVMLDGAPLAKTAVNVQGRGFTERIITSADGELSVPLDRLPQPEAIGTLQLSVTPVQLGTPDPRLTQALATTLGIPTDRPVAMEPPDAEERLATAWFEVSVPVNLGEHSAKEVAIETGELEVGLKGSPGIPNDTPLNVVLARDEKRLPRPTIRLPGKPWQSVVFQNVQVGEYRLLVQGAGLAQPQWLEVHVTKRGSLKLVELSPGRTVRATLAGDGWNFRLTSRAKLLRDGVEMNTRLHARGDRWEGLPLGKYRLLIPAAKQLRAAQQLPGFPQPRAAQLPGHAEYEMEFELTAGSPAIVDLGVIKLKAEE